MSIQITLWLRMHVYIYRYYNGVDEIYKHDYSIKLKYIIEIFFKKIK